MSYRRVTASLALASYLLATVVVPVLHRLHHLAHGADHVHTALGTIYFGHPEEPDDDDDDDDHDHHDHDHPDQRDSHGDGALEHGQAHYLCAGPIVLPAPSTRVVRVVVERAYQPPRLRFRTTSDARGPPRSA